MKGLETAGDPLALFGGAASPVITQLLREAAVSYLPADQPRRGDSVERPSDRPHLPVYSAL